MTAAYCWSGELNYNLPSKEATFTALHATCNAFPHASRQECRLDSACNAQRVFEAEGEYRPESLPAPDLKLSMDQGESGWWLVLRPSGNEPKLRLNVEAWGKDAKGSCEALVHTLDELVIQHGGQRA